MYKVIKEFAGIKIDEDIELNRNDAEYMIENGYVVDDEEEALEAAILAEEEAKKLNSIPAPKAYPEKGKKTKIDPESENLKNK